MSAHAQETCERNGVEFGFFNGVRTLDEDAQDVVTFYLPRQYGHTTPDGQPISYTLYYNDTQAGLTDFIETFEQRLQEQDGLLAGRFELFFSAMDGGGGWWRQLTETLPALGGLLDGLFDTFRSQLVRDMTADFGSPNTFEVSQRHREQIDHAVAMDKGLLLFAHSQGNLFANRAYDHALTQVGAESVRVVHVAPASPRQTGPHVLADLDIVINALRVAGHVLPVTDRIPGPGQRVLQPDLSDRWDMLGHGLLETYLNRNFDPAARIRRQVEQALEELRSPQWIERPPYPEFVERPWTGGPRPTVQVNPGRVSHNIESKTITRSDPRQDPNTGYRFERRAIAGTDRMGWALLNRRSQFIYDGVGYTSERSSVMRGPGVAGSAQCRYKVAGQCDGIGAVMTQEIECTFDHHLGNPPHLWWLSHLPVDELRPHENSPAGTIVHIDQATIRPPENHAARHFSRRPPLFLTGRVHRLKEWRGVPGFYENTYRCPMNRLIDENTLTYSTETFVATPAEIRNLEEIRRWDEAYAQWQTLERQRWVDHQTRWQAWLRWRATVCPTQQIAAAEEGCTPEDPRPECLSLRGERD